MGEVLFTAGPVPVYTFGAAVAAGGLAGAWLFGRELRRRALPPEVAATAPWVALVGGMASAVTLGALGPGGDGRLFPIVEGELTFYGGLAGGTVALGLWGYRAAVPLGVLFDAATRPLVVGGILGALGSGLVGPPTEVPWGISLADTLYHPWPLYLALGQYGLLEVLHRWEGRVPPGGLFTRYLVSYGLLRALLGFWRVDPPFGGLPLAMDQGLSLLAAGAGGLGFLAVEVRERLAPRDPVAPGPAGARGTVAPGGGGAGGGEGEPGEPAPAGRDLLRVAYWLLRQALGTAILAFLYFELHGG